MKNFKKVLALVLVVATLLSFATVASAATSASYTDADKVTRTAAVDVLSYIGVLNGYTDKTFRPQGEITRAEAAKIIAMFDNGDATINGLYASANPFTDCVGHWAESSIAYCYKMGIIDGVGNLKFDPEANVTGIQFLKMALIVLGFDAKKEGLTGASWAVNTLALAKKTGLLVGLGNSYDYAANLIREDAAQIMLNALKANVVEYGYAFKPTGLGNNEGEVKYITTAGAVATGDKLFDSWNLGKRGWEDPFMRPGEYWYVTANNKETTIAKYLDTPIAKHQTAVTGCDLLIDAGIPKTDLNSKIVLQVFLNGAYEQNFVLNHTTAHDCTAALKSFGAQGTQAELYFMGYNTAGTPCYRLVLIETWLGVVKSVAKTTIDKDGHIKAGGYMTVSVWCNEYDNGDTAKTPDMDLVSYVTGFAKGDYVLVTYSEHKDYQRLIDVDAAVIKDGVLTGYTNKDKTGSAYSETEVDNVEIADAAKFNLGYADSKVTANVQKYYVSGAYTFYYDLFGNVIGMTGRAAAATQYIVVDAVWAEHVKNYPVTGDVVTMDAAMKNDAPFAELVARDDKDYVEFANSLSVIPTENTGLYDQLFEYSVDADGNYYLTKPTDTVWTASEGAYVVKGDPNIYREAGETGAWGAYINEDTQFLLRTAAHTYSAYTGFENVPTFSAKYAEWIDNDGDGYADVVYACSVKFDGTSDICFTFDTTKKYIKSIKGVTYDVWSVYIDGERNEVYTKTADNAQFPNAGLYHLEYETVDGVVVAKVTALVEGTDFKKKDVAACDQNALRFTDFDKAYNVTGIPVYLADTAHYEVELGETADLDGAENVWVQYNAAGAIVAFYIPYAG